MAIAFTCECGKEFRAKAEYAGKRGLCPACGREFLIPTPSAHRSTPSSIPMLSDEEPAEEQPFQLELPPQATIEIKCDCGRRLKTRQERGARKARCPFCGKLHPIPRTVAKAPPAESRTADSPRAPDACPEHDISACNAPPLVSPSAVLPGYADPQVPAHRDDALKPLDKPTGNVAAIQPVCSEAAPTASKSFSLADLINRVTRTRTRSAILVALVSMGVLAGCTLFAFLLRARDPRTWANQLKINSHHQLVRSVAFSPDSKILATSGADKAIRLWSVWSGEEIFTLTGHQNDVFGVAFSRDGSTVYSGSTDDCQGMGRRDWSGGWIASRELWCGELGRDVR